MKLRRVAVLMFCAGTLVCTPPAFGDIAPADRETAEGVFRVVAEADKTFDAQRHDSNSWQTNQQRIGEARAMAKAKLEPIGSRIIPLLIQKLSAPEREVALVAAGLLGSVGAEAVPPLIKGLNKGTIRNAHWAYYALQQIGTPAFLSVNTMVESKDPAERMAGLKALQTMVPEPRDYSTSSDSKTAIPIETVNAVIARLSDPDAKVRAAAATVLGHIGPRNGALVHALNTAVLGDRDPAVRQAAAKSLGFIGMRQNDLPAAATAKVLAQALEKDDYEGVRAEAAAGLGRIPQGGDVAVAALNKAVQSDQVKEVSKAAIEALSKFGGASSKALPTLIEQLKVTQDRQAKCGIIRTISKMGPQAAPAVPALVDIAKTTSSQDLFLRWALADAFAGAGKSSQPAVPYLKEWIKDENHAVQSSSIKALAAIGPGAKSALPALRKYAAETKYNKHDVEHAIKRVSD